MAQKEAPTSEDKYRAHLLDLIRKDPYLSHEFETFFSPQIGRAFVTHHAPPPSIKAPKKLFFGFPVPQPLAESIAKNPKPLIPPSVSSYFDKSEPKHIRHEAFLAAYRYLLNSGDHFYPIADTLLEELEQKGLISKKELLYSIAKIEINIDSRFDRALSIATQIPDTHPRIDQLMQLLRNNYKSADKTNRILTAIETSLTAKDIYAARNYAEMLWQMDFHQRAIKVALSITDIDTAIYTLTSFLNNRSNANPDELAFAPRVLGLALERLSQVHSLDRASRLFPHIVELESPFVASERLKKHIHPYLKLKPQISELVTSPDSVIKLRQVHRLLTLSLVITSNDNGYPNIRDIKYLIQELRNHFPQLVDPVQKLCLESARYPSAKEEVLRELFGPDEILAYTKTLHPHDQLRIIKGKLGDY